MLDIKGDIEKKKAAQEVKAIEPKEEEKKPTADEKLKEDFGKVKEVVSKTPAPLKAVWHFVPDSAKTVLAVGLGGGTLATIGEKAMQYAKDKAAEKK